MSSEVALPLVSRVHAGFLPVPAFKMIPNIDPTERPLIIAGADPSAPIYVCGSCGATLIEGLWGPTFEPHSAIECTACSEWNYPPAEQLIPRG
jgi:DNA-directed RNA polymerase subunit RPC12/RpoP